MVFFIACCNSLLADKTLKSNGITVPQLSMHSCREVMGIVDLTHGVNIFKAFYNHFRELDDNLSKEIV